MTMVQIAKRIARKAHANQFRRDGKTPYIVHPHDVASRLKTESQEIIAVAWLHDVLEDAITPPDFSGIPFEVFSAVQALTKSKSESYAHFLFRVAANPIAKKVKVADILSNLADAPTENQIRKYAFALTRLCGTFQE